MILAPNQPEATSWSALLAEARLWADPCADLETLCQKLDEGAGAALVAQTALAAPGLDRLRTILAQQPAWSDFPLVVVGAPQSGNITAFRLQELEGLGNAIFLEPPIGPATLLSVVRSALRQRRRQYRVRDCLSGESAGEAIGKSEAHFREVQELSLDAFTFLTSIRDASGKIVDFRWDYVNPAAARLLHRTPEELIGHRMLSILPPSEHSSEVFRRCVEVVETGISHDIEVHYESEGINGWFRNAAVKLGNGLAIYFSDITDQKRVEEALRESEARFRGTFENATVGLGHVDLNGRWLRVNQKLCEILGYSREELLEKSSRDVSHADDRETDRRHFDRLVQGQIGGYALEQRWYHKDGRVLWIHRKMALERDPSGRPQYCIDVVEDISQRKQAEYDLKLLNETLEQRVAERTAVAEQRAELVRALARKLTQAEQRERRRLARLLHDHLQQLLVAARLKANLLRRRVTEAGAAPAFQQIDDLLTQAIESARSLTVELCPPILYESGLVGGVEWLAGEMHENYGLAVQVKVDRLAEPETEELRVLLFETVRELLFNVVKHAGVNRASVAMNREGPEGVQLVIADEGLGFDPAKAESAGTGSGLSSLRERLQWMSGHLEVESAVGRGTRITICVPRRLPPSSPTPLDTLNDGHLVGTDS